MKKCARHIISQYRIESSAQLYHVQGVQLYHIQGVQLYHVQGVQLYHVQGVQLYHVQGVQLYHVQGVQLYQPPSSDGQGGGTATLRFSTPFPAHTLHTLQDIMLQMSY